MSPLEQAFDPEAFRRQAHRMADVLADSLAASLIRGQQVLPWREPEEELAWWEDRMAEPPGEIADFLTDVVAHSIHLHHPRYVGHQVCAPAPAAALAAFVSGLLNNGMAVYQMGPSATALERWVIRLTCERMGFSNGDGILTSGDSAYSHRADVGEVARAAMLVLRFWNFASGFWTERRRVRSWSLTGAGVGIMLAQIATQYALNYWNRDFFNALEVRDRSSLVSMALLLFPLAALSTILEVASVWSRMTIQRLWRQYLTSRLMVYWLKRDRYRRFSSLNSHQPHNPEYRIAEDVRVATDAPVDLFLALMSSIISVILFVEVLARVGGSIDVEVNAVTIRLPAYLVIGVILYSGAVTGSMLIIGSRFTKVVQDQVQAEAGFRAAVNLLRETGEGIAIGSPDRLLRRDAWRTFQEVIVRWRRLCWQHMRITLVTKTNSLLVPVVGLILCAPKFLDGAMTLGEVTQAAAAFTAVQAALNWLVDNFQRMADWRASARRVAGLLVALDELA